MVKFGSECIRKYIKTYLSNLKHKTLILRASAIAMHNEIFFDIMSTKLVLSMIMVSDAGHMKR